EGNDAMKEVVVTKALAGKVAGAKINDKNSVTVADSITFNMVTGKSLEKKVVNNEIQIRKNFNETAFFFPSLLTDENGNVEFSFTIPEALTGWKMMTLAHSKELASGYS